MSVTYEAELPLFASAETPQGYQFRFELSLECNHDDCGAEIETEATVVSTQADRPVAFALLQRAALFVSDKVANFCLLAGVPPPQQLYGFFAQNDIEVEGTDLVYRGGRIDARPTNDNISQRLDRLAERVKDLSMQDRRLFLGSLLLALFHDQAHLQNAFQDNEDDEEVQAAASIRDFVGDGITYLSFGDDELVDLAIWTLHRFYREMARVFAEAVCPTCGRRSAGGVGWEGVGQV